MMKRLFVMLVAAVSFVCGAAAELPKSADELVAKSLNEDTQRLRIRAISTEARANDAFYAHLKNLGWTFDGVALPRSVVVALAYSKGDYDAFDAKEGAKYLSLPKYKTYVAKKVQSFNGNAIEAYDWLQKQRLVVVEVNPEDADKKGEFIAVIAEQVIASDKAKAKSQ